MSNPSFFVTRNAASRLMQERDYRTWAARNRNLEPDAFLLRGKQLVPLYRIASSEEQQPQAKA